MKQKVGVAGLRHLGIALCLAIPAAACAPRTNDPSPESEFLQSQLVPAINLWAKSDSPEMRLFENPAVRSFDYLCLVPEYQEQSIIEGQLQIMKYKGSQGNMVPEMRIAVIGVKGKVAHVGYLKIVDIVLFGPSAKCYDPEYLILKRRRSSGSSIPHASLEERR